MRRGPNPLHLTVPDEKHWQWTLCGRRAHRLRSNVLDSPAGRDFLNDRNPCGPCRTVLERDHPETFARMDRP